MELFIISYISGIISGIISVLFRMREIKNRSYSFGKQLLLQITLFTTLFFLLKNYFMYYEMDIFSFHLSWLYIFFIVMNLSYYQVKILYEWLTGYGLYPSDKEIEDFLEKSTDI